METRLPDLPTMLQAATQPTAELDRLGERIAELSAHLEAATGTLLDLIREFDTRGGWNAGFRSCAEWLAWRVGLDPGAARERVRVARALGALPALADALARGELSYAKVRALTRIATPETETRLLAVGRAGTAAHVERIVRGWRRVDRQAEAREAARQHASRALHVYRDDDGTVLLRGRLTPEAGALASRRRADPVRPVRRGPDSAAAACGRAGAPGGDDAPSRARSRGPGRAVPSGSARRCGSAGRPGSARPVGARGWAARSRGNVAEAGVRREPGGDAAR
jgi:hypothetical protein